MMEDNILLFLSSEREGISYLRAFMVNCRQFGFLLIFKPDFIFSFFSELFFFPIDLISLTTWEIQYLPSSNKKQGADVWWDKGSSSYSMCSLLILNIKNFQWKKTPTLNKSIFNLWIYKNIR